MNIISQKHPLQIKIEHYLSAKKRFEAVLDARRAVYLPIKEWLLISDLHWGKSEVFQQHGIPVPNTVLDADLKRLSLLIDEYQAQEVIVLGDLIHASWGITPDLQNKIQTWRSENGIPITLIAGNHDRQIESFAKDWGITLIEDQLFAGLFSFSHHTINTPDHFNWNGHLHPAAIIKSKTDQLKLPCFHLTPYTCTLPAFSHFTGGAIIKPSSEDYLFVLTDDAILPIFKNPDFSGIQSTQ